jgi:DNA invertase Pin-like site-specific DNA recombinase
MENTPNTHQAATPKQASLRVAEYVRMSTDHQRYSIENQSAFIRSFAERNGMAIVRTYADPGKSGLTIEDRPGLCALISDVMSGSASFRAVLVYDVSRWGRFQDQDESATYEFICRRAGVRVIYCAEPFGEDGTPFSSVIKSMKRAMAGELSRELSVKVFAGKSRLAALGFRMGGVAGYGLRRQLLERGSVASRVLEIGERKSLQTDRVVLVPGPADEVRIVRRIYRDFVYGGLSDRQIANMLNDEGVESPGKRWYHQIVRTILTNEKYIGNNVVNRHTSKLKSTERLTDPSTWIRVSGAFQPIVTQQMFAAAQRVRSFKAERMTDDEVVSRLRKLYEREGILTSTLINDEPGLPSAPSVRIRFGSLIDAYEKAGFRPRPSYRFYSVDRQLRNIRITYESELLRELEERNLAVAISRTGLIHVQNAFTISLRVARCQRPNRRQRWRVSFPRDGDATLIFAVRMAPENARVLDVLTIPTGKLSDLPLFLDARHEGILKPFRHESVSTAADWLEQQI